jgi:NTE family protein
MVSVTLWRMKKALRDWWRSQGLSGDEVGRAGEGANRALGCLPSDQTLIRNDLPQSSLLSALEGVPISVDSPHSLGAAGRDAIDGGWRGRFRRRALLDRDIVRASKENICRLMDRWPAIVRSAGRLSLAGRAPDAKSRNAGRMLCLMPLSEDLPFAEISSICAATIAKETAEPVLCITVRVCSARVLDEVPVAASEIENVFLQRVHGPGNGDFLQALTGVLDRARRRFAHVIIEASQDLASETLMEIVGRSCSVYPILRQNEESLLELNLLCREAHARGHREIAIKPIVYLERLENGHGLSGYIEETLQRSVHGYLRACDATQFTGTLRRLGREMCGCQVGLALSSGAARGLAHVGVLQVLEENGVEVDIVAGSSMGAYIAAVWGAGYGGSEMEGFAREIEGYRGLWRLMDPALFPRRGLLLTDRVRKRLEATIGALHFSDMKRPVRIVATRLDTVERVVLSSGSVVDAVLASLAMPGICVPVMRGGIPYVDGGICDPLPVDALTDIGVRKIIAVNTIATPQTIKACRSEIAASEPSGTTWRRALNTWFNPFASGNSFDTLMRSMHAAQTRLAETSCRNANVVLRPYSCEGRWHDFSRPARYISLGRHETEAKLREIRKLINSPLHERQTTEDLLAQVA